MISGAYDLGIKGSEDQGARGSRDPRIRGPEDQGTLLYLEASVLVEALPNSVKSETPNFCENFIKEKLLILIKESTFVIVAKPRNGWFGHKNGSKYRFLGKFGQKPIL